MITIVQSYKKIDSCKIATHIPTMKFQMKKSHIDLGKSGINQSKNWIKENNHFTNIQRDHFLSKSQKHIHFYNLYQKKRHIDLSK